MENIHPVMAAALAPFAPPATQPMRAYMVTIGRRQPFEAMGRDSTEVVNQHMDLCQPGEKISVQSLDSWREVQREEARVHRAWVREMNGPQSELARAMALSGGGE